MGPINSSEDINFPITTNVDESMGKWGFTFLLQIIDFP